ncbi:hypothetical protein BU23DRAFT_9294 [Bimuria novae-zelandiae CBS 107.79]|uniref:Uncharacterized protein n=1 Tax=Bimuria novae-zelandiae CBS 107.79 TaxID=1447943 RepID=A0A6A5W4P3_9PLEO|nr:hypothetical protein BU23DRAFT_9294 [Bimuria novae-zelandiae CBS 107.79]
MLRGVLRGDIPQFRTDVSGRWEPAQAPTSNLKTFLLSYSWISADVLNLTVSNFKALGIFEYEAGGDIASLDADYDPRGFMHSLVRYCSQSLERLVLQSEGNGIHIFPWREHPPIPDLRGLRKLKTFRCHYSDLVDNPQDEQSDANFDPCTLFPSTLEQLHLEAHDENKLHILESILSTWTSVFPNLAFNVEKER